MASRYKWMANVLTAVVLASAAGTYFASTKRAALPAESELLEDLAQPPEQSEISERAFSIKWRDQDYVLYPVADYTVTGLVVSRNDINEFADIYHSSDSVDVVDVCVVWGGNAHEQVYKKLEFWSEPFSCWYRGKDWADLASFRDDELSNTHVLAKDESLARRLNRIRLGDQIRLHGKLVNYHPAGASEQLRKSSTVRDDTGNGACEVMYVESFELLKRGNPGWNKLFDTLRVVFLAALVLKVVSFVFFPYLEYRAMS